MDNKSNILDEIDNIIQFVTEYPLLDGEIEQQEKSAAEPTFRKMDEDVYFLEW